MLDDKQMEIVASELNDALDKLKQIEDMLVDAGYPDGDVVKSVQMVIAQCAGVEESGCPDCVDIGN